MLGDLRYAPWPWPAHDVAEAAENALAGRLLLPTIGYVDMSDGLDWGRSFENGENSYRLWLHSLAFVHDLVETHLATGEPHYFEHARLLFLDHLRWSEESGDAQPIAWTDEHAVANRCQVVVALLFAMAQRRSADDAATLELAFDSLRRHGAWLAEDRRYIRNNHGVMMDRALLCAAMVLRDEPLSATWRETALRRLAGMLAASFDDDGCATENSPYYHQFNVDLFRGIGTFLSDHGIALPEGLDRTLAKADRVSAIFLRDDGTFPLIGDTVVVRPAARVRRRIESAAFPTAGFALVNGRELSLTAKCGGATFVHRHIDDGSITLRYAGRDLIVDGGLYSYDMGDRVRRWFVSHRAHSGFYVEDSAGVRFVNFPDARALGRILDFRDDGDRCTVAMEVTHVPGVVIRREIEVRQPDTVVIVDRLQADRPVKWRQQFILHPGCAPELSPDRVTVRRDDVRLEIIQERGRPDVAVEAERYSETFLRYEPTRCVVFKGEAVEVELSTVLRCSVVSEIGRTGAVPVATVEIAPDAWSAVGERVRRVGSDIHGARFDCALGQAHGYVQSHAGSFDRLGPGEGGAIPAGAAAATVTTVVRLKAAAGHDCYLGVFLLQFDGEGRRVGGEQTVHRLVTGANTVAAPVTLDPAARRFKLALRIAGYDGPLAVTSAAVAFMPPADRPVAG